MPVMSEGKKIKDRLNSDLQLIMRLKKILIKNEPQVASCS